MINNNLSSKKTNSETGTPRIPEENKYDSTSEQHITTTNYKAKTIIDDFLKKYKTYEFWLGLTIALLIALVSSDFKDISLKDTVLVTKSGCEAIFIVILIVSFILSLIFFAKSKKYTSRYLIKMIRDQGDSLDW